MAAQINRPTLREQQSYELKKKKKSHMNLMVWNNSLKDTRKKLDFNTHEPAQHGAYGPRWAKAWLAWARHGLVKHG